MAFDMTGNWQIGGSSGLLNWGSDIARSWGLGIQNGLNFAHDFRNMQARSMLEPSQLAGQYTQNILEQQRLQNQYTPEFYRGAAEARVGEMVTDQYKADVNHNYGMQKQPTTVYTYQQQAPQSTTNSVVANGIDAAGNQNVATANPGNKAVYSQAQQQTMQPWRNNTYGNGGT